MAIIDPRNDEYEEKRKQFGELFFKKRQRKGVNQYEAMQDDERPHLFWLHDG